MNACEDDIKRYNFMKRIYEDEHEESDEPYEAIMFFNDDRHYLCYECEHWVPTSKRSKHLKSDMHSWSLRKWRKLSMTDEFENTINELNDLIYRSYMGGILKMPYCDVIFTLCNKNNNLCTFTHKSNKKKIKYLSIV